MPRKRTAEEIRHLKELGAFDVGRTYTKMGGFSRIPKYKPWDEDDEDEDS